MTIQISHYKKIDTALYRKFESLLNNFIKKFSKMHSIQKFFIYVDTYKVSGKTKYSLRARLLTPHNIFPVHSHGWDLMDATHSLLDKLEKEFRKHHELRDVRKHKISERLLHVVTEKCTGCSLCVSLYPDVFEIGKDGHAIVKKGVKIDREKLKDVIRSCPTQTIELTKDKE